MDAVFLSVLVTAAMVYVWPPFQSKLEAWAQRKDAQL